MVYFTPQAILACLIFNKYLICQYKIIINNKMEQIKKAIDVNVLHIDIYKRSIPIIESYKGKTVSKRLATLLEKELTGFYVSYNPDKYGNRSITISGNGLNYDNSISLDFSIPLHYGQCSRVKTELESVDDTLAQAKARLNYTILETENLRKELDTYTDIKNDYIKLIKNINDQIQAFKKTYGNNNEYKEYQLTHTTRAELEKIDKLPNSLY